MIIDNDLNDSVEVAARMLALQQKQRSNDGMGMSPPSPLLSSEDVSFVKVGVQNSFKTSTRFTVLHHLLPSEFRSVMTLFCNNISTVKGRGSGANIAIL